mmetsp:Transcript_53246/g.143584  ORF Transcript_53246/g.143584 Transcript_53246/m.143584 type:complete len:385 (+) Transcript_53246:107-1261(+)
MASELELEPLNGKDKEGSKDGPRGFWRFQPTVRECYESTGTQGLVAFIILLNFFMQCCQRELVPAMSYMFNEHPGKHVAGPNYQYFDKADVERASSIFAMSVYLFNWVFLVELLFNLYGKWPLNRCSCQWFADGWNVFDFIVVSLGVIDLMEIDLPGPLKMIRMLRAFRIFRLFGRVPALKKIINSLFHAAGGMCNGMMLVLVVTCIYSSLAVDLYGDLYCPSPDDFPEDLRITRREKCFGNEYYGNFLLAIYTMFQILTGESWSEAAVRPIVHYHCTAGGPFACIGSYFFFISFICITAVVLLNVFAVCLLDAYAEAPPAGVAEAAIAADAADDDEVQSERSGDEDKELKLMEQEINKFKDDALARLKLLSDAVEIVAVKLGV